MSFDIPAFTITGLNAYWFVFNMLGSLIGIILADAALNKFKWVRFTAIRLVHKRFNAFLGVIPVWIGRYLLLLLTILRFTITPIAVVGLLLATFSAGSESNGTRSLIIFHLAAAVAGVPIGHQVFTNQKRDPKTGQGVGFVAGLIAGFVGLIVLTFVVPINKKATIIHIVPPPPALRDLPPEQRRALLERRMRRGCVYSIATSIAIWILLPIWLIFTMAFSTVQDVRSFPKHWFPEPFSSDTIQFFFNVQGIPESTMNSITVAIITLILSTIIAVPAGYAIARFIFWGRNATRLGILAVRAFPVVILAVPLAVTFIEWDLFDTVWAVALVHTALTLPTTVLVVASVFASVPRELEEAAKVFGCGSFGAFRQVVLPLALPGIAASAIFTFVMSWNEVFAAILLTIQNRTLPAEILYSLDKSGDPFKFTGGFFMLVPSMIFIFYIRRYLFNMWGQITK